MGLRSVCTNTMFFTHPDTSNEHVNILIRKKADSSGSSYLFQLLDEYEANPSNINSNSICMERLIFDEFMVNTMSQAQDIISSLLGLSDGTSVILELNGVETRAVLYFFYVTGILVGIGIRNGTPMHLHLPSIFYTLIGSIIETKKVANFHSKLNDGTNSYDTIVATCALTLRLGLSSVFPEAALNLFNSNDIRTMLSSTSSLLSPYLLQTFAQYEGIDSEEKHIGMFWSLLKRLSKKRILAFLKKIWKEHQLPEYVYYESQLENHRLPAPLLIKAPTALGLLTPDECDIIVLPSGMSLPRYTNSKYMMDKIMTFLRN